MNKKTVFVTGGTGKIGHSLVARLASLGFCVKVLSRRQDYPWDGIDNIQIIKGDILDEETVRKGLEGCDYLFHLAVYQNINDKRKDMFRRINVEGTKTILNSSINSGIERVVYVSTAMAFQATGKLERDEKWIQKISCTCDNYLQTKIEALALVRQMKKVLPVVIVYPTAVIDLKDFSSSAPVQSTGWQNFLWRRVGGGIPGGLISLIGSKDRIFNYVVVDDLVEGIIQAAIVGQAGEEYILGGENITAENYLRAASQRVSKKVFAFRIPIYPFKVISRFRRFVSVTPIINLISQNSQGDMCFSSEKAMKILGYNPKLKL
ncbi:NAD-dependent epimerase/dehydratase family protein [bacterium]|nr:NAD-dependent epimerase/dehydratase family protein [bacterium]